MILTCPQCATRYQTDAAQFPPEGRKVRCAKCGNVWHQNASAPEPVAGIAEPEQPAVVAASEAPAESAATNAHVGPAEAISSERTAFVPAAEPEEAPPPVVAAPIKAEMPRERRPEKIAVLAGWFGLAAILVAIAWSVIHFREAIASAWPQSASLYSAVGMKVNARGIDISDIVSSRATQGGQTVLSIKGDLTNITDHAVDVPDISIRLTDDAQHELDHWTFPAGSKTLKPGQTIAFSTRRTNPPDDARHLEVSFAEAGG